MSAKEKERKALETKESEHLERSMKKFKETVKDDCPMDDIMADKNAPVEDEPIPVEVLSSPGDIPMKSLEGRKLVSYKDKILSFNGQACESDSEEEDWKERQRREA